MDREKTERSGGLSLQTLAISAAAAVAAAVVVPMIWERGTLIATAMTPVIVALVSEALRKPAEVVRSAAPRVARRNAAEPANREFDPLAPARRSAEPEPGFEPEAPSRGADDPFGLHEPASRRGAGVRRHWRLALATGAVAFVVAVVGLTASELVFGGPATADGGRTTFFSSRDDDRNADRERERERERRESQATPAPTAVPETQATPAPEPTPEATPTPAETPEPTATPAPGAVPPEPTPAPTP